MTVTARLDQADGCLQLHGQVTPDNVLVLRKQGETMISQAVGALQVDLGGAHAASSVLLSLLLCWQRAARRQQCQLTFSRAPSRLVSLAALSGLQETIGIH
ncbi:MAG: STAS domain-containing protein [Marinobacter sp.]|nr:STAS domain-containing protein [Marinobacter sp.]